METKDKNKYEVRAGTGFRFKTRDISKIHNEIMEFRKEIMPIVQLKYNKYIAIETVSLIDQKVLGIIKEFKDNNPYVLAISKFIYEKQMVELTHKRNELVDYSCEVVVIPKNGVYYGLLYSDQKEFFDIWFSKSKLVEDYGYSCDIENPNLVSDKEWNKRGKLWAGLLKDFNGIPSMNGMDFQCFNVFMLSVPKYEELMQYLPSFEDRIMSNTTVLLYSDLMNEQGESAISFVDYMEWIKGDGKERFRKKKLEVAESLLDVRKITEGMMLGKNI